MHVIHSTGGGLANMNKRPYICNYIVFTKFNTGSGSVVKRNTIVTQHQL